MTPVQTDDNGRKAYRWLRSVPVHVDKLPSPKLEPFAGGEQKYSLLMVDSSTKCGAESFHQAARWSIGIARASGDAARQPVGLPARPDGMISLNLAFSICCPFHPRRRHYHAAHCRIGYAPRYQLAYQKRIYQTHLFSWCCSSWS